MLPYVINSEVSIFTPMIAALKIKRQKKPPPLPRSNPIWRKLSHVNLASRANLSTAGEKSSRDGPSTKDGSGMAQVPRGEKRWDAKSKQEK
jgi:hypothetical protein